MVAEATKIGARVVNGINVNDLFDLIDAVKQDAEKGQTSWRVTTAWQGQTRSRAHVDGFGIGGQAVSRQFSLDVDEPLELGGSNHSANPQEYLIAALNACIVVGNVAQCATRGITIETLAVETEGNLDLRGFLGIDPAVAAGYEELRSVVRIKGSGTREQFAEIRRGHRDFAELLQHLPAHRAQTNIDR